MAKLTSKQRDRMSKSTFAIPSRRAYPIPDKPHAIQALARVAQHGTPAEKRQVRTAVTKRYPSLKKTGKK
jgi:hypothetical protein